MKLSELRVELHHLQMNLSTDPEVYVQVSCEGDPLSQIEAYHHNGESRVTLYG